MPWTSPDSYLTAALSPTPTAIFITLLITILLPVLVHSFLYRKGRELATPSFLLVGPSGGGKTSWLTLAERKEPTQTHTSTSPLSISATLPEEFVPSSASFRSPGDPSYERARRFLLIDTPGHGKLRHFATSYLTDITKSASIRGILFVVDAAAVAEEAGLNEAAEYLHDVLLALQKRHTGSKTSKGPKPIPVLVAANKSDLFTALPSNLIKINLERAITEVRKSRARGVRDVGNKLVADGEDEGVDEEREWLGEGGEGPFEFGAMEEFGTEVVVKGGNVLGGDESDVGGWWGWVGEQL